MSIGIIIQARMGSERLPNKVLMDLSGKPVLKHIVDRVKQSKKVEKIIIATTINPKDDSVVDFCKLEKLDYFRGSEENVLERFHNAAKVFEIDTIIRITGDCPLVDPKIIDKMIGKYLKTKPDILTNAGLIDSERTFPRGLDAEVFSYVKLLEAHNNADKKYQKEHVTPYIYENSNRINYFKNSIDLSNIRITLDTIKDYELIKIVYENLYAGKHDFYLKQIEKLFKLNPQLIEINSEIKQKDFKYES